MIQLDRSSLPSSSVVPFVGSRQKTSRIEGQECFLPPKEGGGRGIQFVSKRMMIYSCIGQPTHTHVPKNKGITQSARILESFCPFSDCSSGPAKKSQRQIKKRRRKNFPSPVRAFIVLLWSCTTKIRERKNGSCHTTTTTVKSPCRRRCGWWWEDKRRGPVLYI